MSYTVAMLCIHTSPLDLPGRTKDAGGMNVYIRELARELGNRQMRVDIFTRWTSSQTPQIVQVSPSVRVIHIKAGPRRPVQKHDLYQYLPLFTQQIEEFRLREKRQYDLVHSHYWLSGVAGLELAANWNIPHVTMFHTLARLKQLAHPAEQESLLRLEMEARLMQEVDLVIAPTTEERVQMIRHCGAAPDQVVVVPCGIDLKHFGPRSRAEARLALELPLETPLLLFAGRLDPYKGPDVLLRAAALMQQEAQIVIVGGELAGGGDQEIQKLRALADTLGIASRVHFLGARSPQEMPTIYSAVDITAVPSYNESFGLAAAESLACGTPVVATRAGGLTSIVRHGETGYLVTRCPGFFAERLDALLRRPELLAHMRQAARPSVLRFGWTNVAGAIRHLYTELIDEAACLLAQ